MNEAEKIAIVLFAFLGVLILVFIVCCLAAAIEYEYRRKKEILERIRERGCTIYDL